MNLLRSHTGKRLEASSTVDAASCRVLLVPKLHLGTHLSAKLHFAAPGHGPGEEKRRHGRAHSKLAVFAVTCVLLVGCYSSQPAAGGYAPKTHAIQKHAEAVDALKTNRLNDALAAIDEAVKEDPEYADAAMTRALVLLRGERLGDAAAAYDAVCKKWPDRAEAHALAGIVREKTGKAEVAKACYSSAKAAYDRRIAAGDHAPDTQLSRTLAVYLLDGRSAGLVEINKLLGEYPDYGPAQEVKAKIVENNRAFLLEWMERPGK